MDYSRAGVEGDCARAKLLGGVPGGGSRGESMYWVGWWGNAVNGGYDLGLFVRIVIALFANRRVGF